MGTNGCRGIFSPHPKLWEIGLTFPLRAATVPWNLPDPVRFPSNGSYFDKSAPFKVNEPEIGDPRPFHGPNTADACTVPGGCGDATLPPCESRSSTRGRAGATVETRHPAYIEHGTVRNKVIDSGLVLCRWVQMHRGWNLLRNRQVKVLGLHLSQMVLKREHGRPGASHAELAHASERCLGSVALQDGIVQDTPEAREKRHPKAGCPKSAPGCPFQTHRQTLPGEEPLRPEQQCFCRQEHFFGTRPPDESQRVLRVLFRAARRI
jgi:hypothetical protein